MAKKRPKFVLKRIDNARKGEVNKYFGQVKAEGQKKLKELTGEDLPPEALQFEHIDITTHNQVVETVMDSWDKVDEFTKLAELRQHLKSLVEHIYKTSDREEILKKIQEAIEYKQSYTPSK